MHYAMVPCSLNYIIGLDNGIGIGNRSRKKCTPNRKIFYGHNRLLLHNRSVLQSGFNHGWPAFVLPAMPISSAAISIARIGDISCGGTESHDSTLSVLFFSAVSAPPAVTTSTRSLARTVQPTPADVCPNWLHSGSPADVRVAMTLA